ncbi:MAG: purine-nucleoside phosphorylase, partial [Tidjanibacter sp.]|nr:purine-nucleoside phosphorylase [Tidjanibacter sp.]
MINAIKQAARYIDERTQFTPEVGIILGTGLGGLVEKIEIEHSIPYSEIPGFPVSTVEGHSGRLIMGVLGGKRVVAMQGRFHYYEGYTAQQVVFPVRVMKFLGIKTLFVSNAAGSMNSTFRVGDVMVINDHINLIPNPLIGRNIDELGPRFPAMNDAYNPELIERATKIAEREGIKLQYGCYVALTGPTFETPKEYMWV